MIGATIRPIEDPAIGAHLLVETQKWNAQVGDLLRGEAVRRKDLLGIGDLRRQVAGLQIIARTLLPWQAAGHVVREIPRTLQPALFPGLAAALDEAIAHGLVLDESGAHDPHLAVEIEVDRGL